MNLEPGYLEIILAPCGKLWTLAGLEEEKQCQLGTEHALICEGSEKEWKSEQGDGTRIMRVLKQQ